MEEEFKSIIIEKSGALVNLTLNRPAVINAYNMSMRDEIYQALELIRDDSEIEIVILSGKGEKGFCAGSDIKEFGSAESQVLARQASIDRNVWKLWGSIHKIFIACLHGYVLGSGLEMASLCDIRIASQEATFGMPETALGMIPAAGGTQTIPRIVGLALSSELLFRCKQITAFEAKRFGLVHEVVPRTQLHKKAQHIAQKILDGSPSASMKAKQAMLEGADMNIANAINLEQRLALEVLTSQ